MRIKLQSDHRNQLFVTLKDKGFSLDGIARMAGVSSRTVFDWRRGKYTIPSRCFEQIINMADLKAEIFDPYVLKEWWNNGQAGKKGAVVRELRHGPLGTPESRSRGGHNSYLRNNNLPTSIFAPKAIHEPLHSKDLAEFIGILIGDGGLTQYQVAVSTNAVDDYEYSLYVAQLFDRLFGIRPSLVKRKDQNCVIVVASSVLMVRFLKSQGIKQGNKLKQGLDIPPWILKKQNYAKACLQGIFDTDGCIFEERHVIKGKVYSYPRLSFVSASNELRLSIYKVLTELSFNPKIRNNRSVNLESRRDIDRYFRIIGTSNPKHLNRFENFGGVG